MLEFPLELNGQQQEQTRQYIIIRDFNITQLPRYAEIYARSLQ